MLKTTQSQAFQTINRSYNQVFQANRLSVGLVAPLENHGHNPVPTMANHIEQIQLAESLGFAAVWLRDVPFNVPTFGDAGQTYDPFVYLGYLAAQTKQIALGVSSIILPLRHPAHIAKAAATVDMLSGGRLILGIASGDRPEEYPAFNLLAKDRGERFRQSFEYIRQMSADEPTFVNDYGVVAGGMDMLPKPTAGRLPLLITGASQQSPDWLAENGDGWMIYPRNIPLQTKIIGDWRSRLKAAGQPDKPVLQPLYIDLADDPEAKPQPIHLGLRLGTKHLLNHLKSLEEIGVNHVALNLRFNKADIETTMKRLAEDILPEFA